MCFLKPPYPECSESTKLLFTVLRPNYRTNPAPSRLSKNNLLRNKRADLKVWSRCSANNRRVLPIRLDLFKNKTDTALSLLTDEYISRAFARRDRWTQLECVFTLTLNPWAFSYISRLDVPRSAADRVTSDAGR